MKKYTYLITFLLIILSCKKEKPIDIIKENELDEFSKHIFDQKIIDSKEILRLIESKTVTKFKDTADYNRTPKATIFAINSFKTYFQVFVKPKNVISALAYYKNGKQIYAAEYYDNGTVMCKFNRSKEGIRNGKYECYYENGKIRSTGEYLNDKQIGFQTEYDRDGNITSELDFNKKWDTTYSIAVKSLTEFLSI